MISLRESIESYLNDLKTRHRSPRTCYGEAGKLRIFQTYCAARQLIDIQQIKLKHVGGFAKWLKEDSQRSELTRYATVGTVRRWLKWATYRGHLLENPAASWQPRHPPTPFRKVPTHAQMRELLEAPDPATVHGQRDRVLLEFLYGTGLRVQECSLVTLLDLDLKERTVAVHGKGGTPRCQPLGLKLTAALLLYLDEIRPLCQPRDKTMALFLDNRGNPMQSHRIAHRVLQYSKKISGVTFSTHCIRHAFATHLLLNGAPVWAVQRLLGHESIGSTAVYTRLFAMDIGDEFRRTHPRAKANKRSPGKPGPPDEP